MHYRAYSGTVLHYVVVTKKPLSFILLLMRQLYQAHVVEFLLEKFSTIRYCFFYSTFYSLLHQVSVKLTTVATIPNTVHYSKTVVFNLEVVYLYSGIARASDKKIHDLFYILYFVYGTTFCCSQNNRIT